MDAVYTLIDAGYWDREPYTPPELAYVPVSEEAGTKFIINMKMSSYKSSQMN